MINVTVLRRTSTKGHWKQRSSMWLEGDLPPGVAEVLALAEVSTVRIDHLGGKMALIFHSEEHSRRCREWRQ